MAKACNHDSAVGSCAVENEVIRRFASRKKPSTTFRFPWLEPESVERVLEMTCIIDETRHL
jgi:hypothetical protein